ncbi:MAG: hypothetical protein ABSA62_16295 [Methyloceanibacter sp.]
MNRPEYAARSIPRVAHQALAGTNLNRCWFDHQMGFNPPLENLLPPGPESYIVYAPSDARDQHEQDQLESLLVAFGAGVGTF